MGSYNLGIKKTVESVVWAKELGVKMVTSWALSKENLQNRSKLELGILFRLYRIASYDKNIRKIISSNGIRVNVIGELSLLPKSVIRALRSLEEYAAGNSSIIMNILICYSGKDDILSAVKDHRGKQYDKVGKGSSFRDSMLSRSIPDLDLIIRTSGEKRLSGFLPLQSTYAELYFTDKYWPEVQKKDLEDAVAEFSSRKRRFGK